MIDIEKLVSPLIQEQFPGFYQEEGPRFVDFVKQYYIWLESQNQALNVSRSLFDYRDIDKTSTEFLSHFKSKYLDGMPLDASSDIEFLTKHSIDFYRSKGTQNSVELLFRGLYNEDVVVYLPGEDVLKSSAGRWVKPLYLELTSASQTVGFVGREVIGNRSKAKAFVEAVVTRLVGGNKIDIAYLSSVRGEFITNEYITLSSNTSLTGAPKISGSLTSLTVVSGGAEFSVGDIVDIKSATGKQGKARVAEVSNQTGKVFFYYANTLVSGGWGYSTENSNVLVAQKMLQTSNKTNANLQISDFKQFETISQQLANITYTTARPNNANFSIGDVLENYSNTTGAVVANAVVVALGTTNTTAGFVVVAPYTGNLAVTDTVFAIKTTGSAGSITFNALTGVANATDIITTTSAHTFVNNDIVVYKLLSGNTVLSGLSVGAAYYVVNAPSGGATLQLSDTQGGTPVDITAGSSETGHVLIKSQGSAVITNYTDRTTYANVIGTNTQYVGVINVVGQGFVSTPYANIVGTESNTIATVSNIGTGTGATFNVGLLTDKETVFLSPDRLRLKNSANVYFVSNSSVSINLNGNNSGAALQYGSPQTLSTSDLAYGGFGFAKYTGSNLDSILYDCLSFDSTVIGSIATLTGLNPGADYNIDPFVIVVDTFVSGYDRHDYLIEITPVSGTFLYGEEILQSINATATELTVNTFSGTAANGTSTTTVAVNEFVYQSNNTTNVVASGYVMEAGLSGGAGVIKLRDVTGTFAVTTNANTKLKTLTTGGTANISFVDTSTFATEARGYVKQLANSTFMKVKRINLNNTFEVGAEIVGRSSSARATINSFTYELSTPPIGINANITANVQVANNVATKLGVIDSGFGYGDFETVTLTNANNQYTITAIVRLGLGGSGEGFYRSTKGFLDSTDKLHDNEYYHDYSYEIQSRIPYNKYINILKKVAHMVGSRPFGKVLVTSLANTQISGSSSITIT